MSVEFIDPETKQPISGEVVFKQILAGEPQEKRIIVRNRHFYPVQLINPQTTSPQLAIVSYPDQVLSPGQEGEILLRMSVPYDEISPPSAWFKFDANVGDVSV